MRGGCAERTEPGFDRAARGGRSVIHRPDFCQFLVFAMNTFGRTSNPATTVYDILLDVNGDGVCLI